MNAHVRASATLNMRTHSLIAFVLQPAAPLADWFETLDGWLAKSPNFFANKPIILDVRSAEARQRDGAIPGSLSAHPEDMQPQLKDLPPDTEIIIYCACPNEATAAIATLHLKRAGFKKIRPLLGGIEAWTTAGRKLEMM